MAHHVHDKRQGFEAELPKWKCPLCNIDYYSKAFVPKKNGEAYETDWYECGGCSVMFHNPTKFARLGYPIARWAGEEGISAKTLKSVHHLVNEQELENALQELKAH